jgi:hypothetical protein
VNNADARVSELTPAELSSLHSALASVLSKYTLNTFLRAEAQAKKTLIEEKKPFDYPSLLLSIHLSPYFLDSTEIHKSFRTKLWSSDRLLAKLVNNGELSPLIWQSFQKLPDARQNQLRLLRGKKNDPLRHYGQLDAFLTLLNSNTQSNEAKKKVQRGLCQLVQEHAYFVSQQLQHDSALRKKYLNAIAGAKPEFFKICIGLINQSTTLANDLRVLLTQAMEAKLGTNGPSYALALTLRSSVQNQNHLATCLLRNSYLCEQHPQFVAKVLLNRTGAFVMYKAKIEAKGWLAANAFKNFLIQILPSFLVRLMAPPLNPKILEIIRISVKDKKELPSELKLTPLAKPQTTTYAQLDSTFNQHLQSKVPAAWMPKPKSTQAVSGFNSTQDKDPVESPPISPIKTEGSTLPSLDSPPDSPITGSRETVASDYGSNNKLKPRAFK